MKKSFARHASIASASAGRNVFRRKFFYLFTCEYCFCQYVVILFLIVTRYKLLYQDWRGYLLALFALVWIANQYMSIYVSTSRVSR